MVTIILGSNLIREAAVDIFELAICFFFHLLSFHYYQHISYIKNEKAHASWILFSGVSVQIHDLTNGAAVANSSISKPKLLGPSEQYPQSFIMKAPKTPGFYLVDLLWHVTFSRGTGLEESSYEWGNFYNLTKLEAATHYNLTNSFYANPNKSLLDSSTLPPIAVEQNKGLGDRSLTVKLQSPVGQFEPVGIIIRQLGLDHTAMITNNTINSEITSPLCNSPKSSTFS